MNYRHKFAQAVRFACLLILTQATAQAFLPRGEIVAPLPPVSNGVEVPIRLTRSGHLLVPVTLEDIELPFLLDTAAGRSIITPETCARLRTKATNKRPLRVEGAGGGFDASLVDVGSFGVGHYRRRQMSVVMLDLKPLQTQIDEPFAGVIGMDFLRNYNVRVDLEAKKLRLHACDEAGDASALVGDEALERVQFKVQHGGLIMLKIQLDGAPVTGLLDTGAGRTIMNWHAARATGVTRGTTGVRKLEARYFGVDKNPISLFSYEFKQLEIGSARYSPANINIADLPVFAALGFKDQPAIIIGADFLKDRVLLIAQSTGHVYLSRDEAQNGELASQAVGR